MNDFQLYTAIGIPIVFNVLGFTLMSGRLSDLNKRTDDLRADMSSRFVEISGRIGELRSDIHRLSARLDELIGKVADIGIRLHLLENRPEHRA